MPPKTDTVKAPEAATDDPAAFDLTVDEFCVSKSRTDRRPEMIGGFHADELRAGHVKDSEANFEARYQAFAVRPA